MRMRINSRIMAVAVGCLCLAALHTQAQAAAKPRGEWIWSNRLQIEFKPTAAQTAAIDAAVAKGEKSVRVELTAEQANWIKTNYGFTVPATLVRLPKTTPKGFKVTVAPDYSIEFHDFFAMRCGTYRGTKECVTTRYQAQVEVWPDKQRPTAAALDALKIAPVFTKTQRQAIEAAKRNGKTDIDLTASKRQQMSFKAMSTASPAAKMQLSLMQLTSAGKAKQDAQLHALGCTMSWEAWCDKYGCHELCVPQCD